MLFDWGFGKQIEETLIKYCIVKCGGREYNKIIGAFENAMSVSRCPRTYASLRICIYAAASMEKSCVAAELSYEKTVDPAQGQMKEDIRIILIKQAAGSGQSDAGTFR